MRILTSVLGLLGALTGGALVTPLGRRRALILFGVTQALSVGGYLYLAAAAPGRFAIYAACAAEHFASGLGTAALFTAMMDWARPRHAATDYTVQASTVVIATGLAQTVSGLVADAIGYAGTFLVAVALCAVGTGAAWLLFPRRTPRGEDLPPPVGGADARTDGPGPQADARR